MSVLFGTHIRSIWYVFTLKSCFKNNFWDLPLESFHKLDSFHKLESVHKMMLAIRLVSFNEYSSKHFVHFQKKKSFWLRKITYRQDNLHQVYEPKWPLGSDLLPQEGVKLTERRFLVNAASETARATMARARKCAKFSFIFTGTKLSILYMLICFKTTSYWGAGLVLPMAFIYTRLWVNTWKWRYCHQEWLLSKYVVGCAPV